MRKWEYIIIHHSASPWLNEVELRSWHLARGFSDIGYHYFILNGFLYNNREYDLSKDGIVGVGRDIEKDGAHTLNWNSKAIGICLAGDKGLYTFKQIYFLNILLKNLMEEFEIPIKNILGHYEVDPVKKPLCPSIDMNIFRNFLRRIT